MPVYPSVLVFLDGTPPTTCPASLHCAVANMQRASAPTLAESVGAHMVEAIEHQLRWNYFSAFARTVLLPWLEARYRLTYPCPASHPSTVSQLVIQDMLPA
ncbi:uncharacterized protein SETTUDRAFT_152787 [Exserohilum turcica Et28A]|uniref:Uncharacterized protein n=1 Tax=Exserohilum turcicum (strain 28A) TaxID=671987 RepID=R0J4T9_EXST2|nr:uncharacterized protein SETTUDRAFT_152787 [Exserohilum turcica Et28A]EOA91741.1 hypothetical protein SETTUDRAFT_152787 [Exserohilum turcica Et28A]